MLTELSGQPRVVGARQVLRAVESGRAAKVFLADDADPRVADPIARLCGGRGVAVERTASRKELGRLCGIAVGSAVAATLKEDA